MNRLLQTARSLWKDTQGSVFVEYLLLVTLVGIGVMAGLSMLRAAMIAEMADLAVAIQNISP